jgi:hypothetical protein
MTMPPSCSAPGAQLAELKGTFFGLISSVIPGGPSITSTPSMLTNIDAHVAVLIQLTGFSGSVSPDRIEKSGAASGA